MSRKTTRVRSRHPGAAARAGAPPATPGDPIRHVIVLMLENRSFDHAIGALQSVMPALDGVPPTGTPRSNRDSEGRDYLQTPTSVTRTYHDLPHETREVLVQIERRNAGFVRAYEHVYPSSTTSERQEVMSYYDVGALPALHALAQSFLVCDAWHASVPGPTWTNRFFVHSGTSLGRVKMPEGIFHANLHWYDQDTIYDRLNDRDIPWKVYAGDIAQSLLLVHQLEPKNARRYASLDRFFADVERPASEFPAFAFLEPCYFGAGQNDDHPPSDVLAGERLIARVYNALRARPDLWTSSLLVVLFDEHGGFYDHVEPPAATPPDAHHEEYAFDRLGLRVPAVLVSPWVEAGVLHERFDHTSLLRYLCDKWGLGPLGRRAEMAQSFAPAIRTTGAPRADTPARIDVPAAAAPRALPRAAAPEARPDAEPALNGNQRALVAFSQYLESQTRDSAERKVARSMRMMASPEDSADVAVERVRRFLAQQRRRTGARRSFARPKRPR
jgi:phospholipase C